MQQWYTAEQAGCANGGTCTISLTPPLNSGGLRVVADYGGPELDGRLQEVKVAQCP